MLLLNDKAGGRWDRGVQLLVETLGRRRLVWGGMSKKGRVVDDGAVRRLRSRGSQESGMPRGKWLLEDERLKRESVLEDGRSRK